MPPHLQDSAQNLEEFKCKEVPADKARQELQSQSECADAQLIQQRLRALEEFAQELSVDLGEQFGRTQA